MLFDGFLPCQHRTASFVSFWVILLILCLVARHVWKMRISKITTMVMRRCLQSSWQVMTWFIGKPHHHGNPCTLNLGGFSLMPTGSSGKVCLGMSIALPAWHAWRLKCFRRGAHGLLYVLLMWVCKVEVSRHQVIVFFFLMWQHIPASGPWMFPVTPLQCCFLNAQKQKKITVDLIHPMLIFATRTLWFFVRPADSFPLLDKKHLANLWRSVTIFDHLQLSSHSWL